VLDLRQALKTVLGDTFSVTHAGYGGNVSVTVSVGIAGIGDGLPFPAVWLSSEYGNSQGSNIGGGGAENEAFCDIIAQAAETDTINAPKLIRDIHAKVEELVRAAEKTTGASFWTNVSAFRDQPVSYAGAVPIYTRVLTVRGVNLQKY
jgi:hypothetical protein